MSHFSQGFADFASERNSTPSRARAREPSPGPALDLGLRGAAEQRLWAPAETGAGGGGGGQQAVARRTILFLTFLLLVLKLESISLVGLFIFFPGGEKANGSWESCGKW